MRTAKIQFRKFGELIKKLLWFSAEKAFLTFLVFLFIALIIGFIAYYRYNALAERTETQFTKEPLQFQQKTYQSVLRIWQEREKKFKEADSKEFSDLPEIIQEEAIPEESSGSPENGQEETGLEESSASTGVDQE